MKLRLFILSLILFNAKLTYGMYTTFAKSKLGNELYGVATLAKLIDVYHGDLNLIKKAISMGVDDLEEIQEGFLGAIKSKYFDIAEFLLNNGAKINIDYGILTPMDEAISTGDVEIVDFLISKGANINEQNIIGITPLIDAVIKNKEQVVKLLLLRGADINKIDEYKGTALEVAKNPEFNENLKIIKILEEWQIKAKQKEISKKLKEADIFPNIEGIRNIISEYTIGLYPE